MPIDHAPDERADSALPRRRLLSLIPAILLSMTGRSPAAAKASADGLPWHHLPDGTFRNPPGSPEHGGTMMEWLDFSWKLMRLQHAEPDLRPGHVLPPDEVRAGILAAGSSDSVTWLGHASFLIRAGGRTMLTDPFLTPRASPLSVAGPKRYVPPGLPPESMPAIDIILLSHNHYDHLDLATLARLTDLRRTTLVVPLRAGRYVDRARFAAVVELDWLQRMDVAGVRVTALPAIHFSKRGLFDRNESLWCGYHLDIGGRRIAFSGDTAYGPVFRAIAPEVPPPDLLLVPIGAYAPRRLMRSVHCTPEEAVAIGRDLGAKRLCAMHWGTIRMTEEPIFEPPERYRAAANAAGYPPDAAWLLAIGETRSLQQVAGEA